MNGSALIRRVPRLFTMVVLAVSGGYLLVYLYRWEWNRALISGLFFLGAEVALVGSSIRADIRALAARTDELEHQAERRLHTQLGESAARPARPFQWLRDPMSSGSANVFVPVLLGAGVIFSAIAFVVERVAGAVGHATADRATAGVLATLEPPAHGLLGPRIGATEPTPSMASRGRRAAGLTGRLAALAVLVVAVFAAIDLLADATQSRPAPVVAGTATVVELRIEQRRPRPVVDAGEALVVACRGTLRTDTDIAGVSAAGADRVRVEVTPALTEQRRRRLFGCIEDATLDLVQAHVTSWHDTDS